MTEPNFDILPQCEYLEGETKYFEYKERDGHVCRYYPYTGTFQSVSTGKIIANDGGRVDFDGSALVTKRWADRRQAIVDGLSEAALDQGIGSTPTEMLSEIIRNQAIQATEQTRDGTGAAKFVLGLMEMDDQGVKEGGAQMTIDLSEDAVKTILEKLAENSE